MICTCILRLVKNYLFTILRVYCITNYDIVFCGSFIFLLPTRSVQSVVSYPVIIEILVLTWPNTWLIAWFATDCLV